MQDDIHSSRKLGAALIAGLIAIVVNTAMLEAADWIPLVTARGGLLKLLKIYFASPLGGFGVADLWAALHLPAADTPAFKTGFHILVGLRCSTLSRAHSLWIGPDQGPRLRAPRLARQCLHRAPLIGEGVAGSKGPRRSRSR